MCGRFSQTQSATAVASAFGLRTPPPIAPRYNIAPTQPVSAITVSRGATERGHHAKRWGLIPRWAEDPAIGNRLINARAETVAAKPAFRDAFQKRRCLIVADGFYEWQRSRDRRSKQPFYVHLQERQPFAFAGLWERWRPPNSDETVFSCTILTTRANALMQPIHHRMPVILSPQDYDAWLDPTFYNPGVLESLLQPYDPVAMAAYPVSTAVNSPGHDGADCLVPLAEVYEAGTGDDARTDHDG